VRRPDREADAAAIPPSASLAEAAALCDVLWLSVPDDEIAGVAAQAAAELPDPPDRPAVAVHSSGLGSLRLLDPLRRAGLLVVCLHPLQTFDDAPDADVLSDVPFAVTAAGDDGRRFGAALVEKLGGRPFRLADDAKPLYHLAAAVAANLLVALESEAGALMSAATGRGREEALALLAPAVSTTARNVGERGAAHALTGPIARGDVGTVRGHLDLLEQHAPHFSQTYRTLSLEALTLAAPRLDDDAVRTLRGLLIGTGDPP